MFGRHSKLRAIFRMKCPRCHQGDLYKTSIFEGIYNMHDHCPKCNQALEPEPGFYWGAMYIGYALSSGYMLSGVALGIWGFGVSPMRAFAFTLVLGILIVPLTARLARSIWASGNISYNRRVSDEVAAREQQPDANIR